MTFELRSAVEVLRRTPAVLDVWLRGLPDEWTRADEGPGTFSAHEVVGHLLNGERADWMTRLTTILEHGEARTFEPFDRFAHREATRGQSLDELLDLFAELRAANLVELEGLRLGPEQLARTGTHPAFGRVTARELLATWTAHDLGHLRQIARVMARRYRDDVGPWRAYLPVLDEGPS